VVAGLQKKNRVMNPKEKEIVAFHESGHAIVAESVEHADPVHKISIIPRGIAALGYTQQQPTEDRYLMTRSELLDRLAVLLGGRVAEDWFSMKFPPGPRTICSGRRTSPAPWSRNMA
jgi:cell division protease FtsH